MNARESNVYDRRSGMRLSLWRLGRVGVVACGLCVTLAACDESILEPPSWSAPDQLSVPEGAVLTLALQGPEGATWQLTESLGGTSWSDADGASAVRFDAPGQYVIDVVGTVAESEDGAGDEQIFEHQVLVDVTPPAFRNLAIQLADNMQPGDTSTLDLLADDLTSTGLGTTTDTVEWASSDSGIASIDGTGLVAVSVGTVTLTATIGGQAVQRSVFVHGTAWVGSDTGITLVDRSGTTLRDLDGRLLGRAGDALVVATGTGIAIHDLAGDRAYECDVEWSADAVTSAAWSAERVALATPAALYTLNMHDCESERITDRGASRLATYNHWLVALDSAGVRAIDPDELDETHEFTCDAAGVASLDDLWIACNDRAAFVAFDPWHGSTGEVAFAEVGVDSGVDDFRASTAGETALVVSAARVVEVEFADSIDTQELGTVLPEAPGSVGLIMGAPSGETVLALTEAGGVAQLETSGQWQSLVLSGATALVSAAPRASVRFIAQANSTVLVESGDGPFADRSAIFGPPIGRGAHAGRATPGSVFEVRDDTSVEIWFDGWTVVDGPGADARIYENAFYVAGTDRRWIDPAIVEWTADGIEWVASPANYPDVPGDDPSLYAGVVGTNPVLASGWDLLTAFETSGGDAFDLRAVGLDQAIAMRIRDIPADARTADIDAIAFQHVREDPTIVPPAD